MFFSISSLICFISQPAFFSFSLACSEKPNADTVSFLLISPLPKTFPTTNTLSDLAFSNSVKLIVLYWLLGAESFLAKSSNPFFLAKLIVSTISGFLFVVILFVI